MREPNSHLSFNHKYGEQNIWSKETLLVNMLTSLSRKISMLILEIKPFPHILYVILYFVE